MTLAIVLIVAAVLALLFIVCITYSQRLQIAPASLATQIQPIDIEAFRNLVDPHEDEYLRRRLPAGEFRALRRQRLRAMAAYIQIAGRNAAVLASLSQAALAAPDASTAAAARQLVESAVLLRRNCAFALVRIYIALVWPNNGPAAAAVLYGYERLNGSAMRLGRLQNPTAPVRILASL